MNQLKKRRRKLTKRLEVAQRARHRLRGLYKWLREHKLKALASVLEGRLKTLTERIKQLHREIRQVENRIERLEQERSEGRLRFVEWVRSQVGVTEYSAAHKKYADEFGMPYSWPWCSIFTSYGLLKFGGFARDELPGSLAYSGSWLNWAHGHRVSYADAQPGDFIIYDWGDGGMTDHVEVYVGDGQGIGGNESDPSGGAVKGPSPVSVGNIVGVVRPNW